MNKLLVVAFCVGTAILVVQSDHHTIYGTVDVDDALHNDTVLNNHLKCLLNMGKCSKESESFKRECLIITFNSYRSNLSANGWLINIVFYD